MRTHSFFQSYKAATAIVQVIIFMMEEEEEYICLCR